MAIAVFLGMVVVAILVIIAAIWWAFNCVYRLSLFVWHKLKQNKSPI